VMSADVISAALSLQHLQRLTDHRGICERACESSPQPEFGYRLSDQARLVIVALRHKSGPKRHAGQTGQTGQTGQIGVTGLVRTALQFIMEAQERDGSFHSRLTGDGRWVVEPSAGEDWGTAMWACGMTAARANSPMMRREALSAYTLGLHQRSIQLRPMCLAALGAAEILSIDPTHDLSLDVLADTADLVWSQYVPPEWPWPEGRLTHLNAVIPEALIAASAGLGRDRERKDSLELLRWLVETESIGNRLSVTPLAGRGPSDPQPAFAQRPIEVASLAEACARAAEYDDDRLWSETILAAGAWFLGHNDLGELLIDPTSGGCWDALDLNGVDTNQGAAASLAMISTLQRALAVTGISRSR
jgi:hypothetical protein